MHNCLTTMHMKNFPHTCSFKVNKPPENVRLYSLSATSLTKQRWKVGLEHQENMCVCVVGGGGVKALPLDFFFIGGYGVGSHERPKQEEHSKLFRFLFSFSFLVIIKSERESLEIY